MTRLLVVVAAVVAAIVLFVVLRPGGDDDDNATTTTTSTTSTQPSPPPSSTATEPPPPPPPPPQPPAVTVVSVRVEGGTPVGGIRRATVSHGQRVAIVVRSDVNDEIHVHGYNLSQNVAPGAPARIRFTADVPGRFEVELEDRGVQLIDLRVRP